MTDANSHSERVKLDEEAVELTALSWLDLAGWRVVRGADLAPEGRLETRADWRDAILTAELRAALARLNPGADETMIETALANVRASPSGNLIENNRVFHKLLVEGVPVPFRDAQGMTRTLPLRLVASDDIALNQFLAANQYAVKGERDGVRADIVLFVNGLPLGLIELKSPLNPDPLLRAFTQIRNYEAIAPELLRANEVQIISDGLTARVGALTQGLDRFAPWRPEEGEVAGGAGELEGVIRTLCVPQRFISHVLGLIAFETDEGRVVSKKIAAYHQARAVHKARERVALATAADGDRRGGVVWHTQGAGKSLTMLLLARALQLDLRLAAPTILILVDRLDLEAQLHATFAAHASALLATPVRAADTEDLRRLLTTTAGGLIFSTIQKFRGEDGGHPLLTDRANVIVFADEAHRTQYGFKAKLVVGANGVRQSLGFAAYVRQALPNATFVGFTGTPVSAQDRDTRAVFGDDIDRYDMRQSVADGATVPIHYTARLARLHFDLNDVERAELDDLGEALAEGGAAIEAEKAKLSRLDRFIGAPERIAEIATDLAEHIDRRFDGMGGGKVMIVAAKRWIAVALYEALIAERPAWAGADPANDSDGRLKVVMTASADDPPAFQPHRRTGARLDALAKRFKRPDSGLDIVIVVDMWLTGFDVPPLHTLYIDKPMHGHGLMQAIARVNRVFGDKPGGLIVDYIGIGAELQAALARYAGDRPEAALDVEAAVRALVRLLEEAESLLEPAPWRTFLDGAAAQRLDVLKSCVEHLLETGRRTEFIERVAKIETAFALAAGTEEAARARDEVALLIAIRSNLTQRARGTNGRSAEGAEQRIKQLLSRAVVSDGILDVFSAAGLTTPNLSILSEEFLAGVRAIPERNLAVEALRRLLADAIGGRQRSNIVEARMLTERLDEAMRRYHNRAVDSLQVIDELIALAREMENSAKLGTELGLSPEEMAFYTALAQNGSAREMMRVEDLRILAQQLVLQIRRSQTIDWTRKESVRAKMRLEVRKLLARYGYPPDLQKAAIDLVIEQAESLTDDFSWT
jgi:type I restriction enzyme R subunit